MASCRVPFTDHMMYLEKFGFILSSKKINKYKSKQLLNVLKIFLITKWMANDKVWQVGGGDRSTFLSTKPTAR